MIWLTCSQEIAYNEPRWPRNAAMGEQAQMSSSKFWIASGAILASVAVMAGAVGTHVLKERLQLADTELQTYEVAVRYQMYHALGLMLVGILVGRQSSRWLTTAGVALLLGIVLFSGGLYARLLAGFQPGVPIVPTGGMAWIVGWLLLAVGALTATDAPRA